MFGFCPALVQDARFCAPSAPHTAEADCRGVLHQKDELFSAIGDPSDDAKGTIRAPGKQSVLVDPRKLELEGRYIRLATILGAQRNAIHKTV